MNIRNEFDQVVREAGIKLDEFPWTDREAYQQWLAQTYFLVRHTTRFLCLAAARSGVENRDLHYHYVKHLAEESHHDLPLIRDLKALGRDPSEFSELVETRVLINNNYHWIECGKVHGLSGYGLLLEGLSIQNIPTMLKGIEASGMKNATAFLRLHLSVDQHHYPEGLAELEEAGSEAQKHAYLAAQESSFLYAAMLERIVKVTSASRSSKKIA